MKKESMGHGGLGWTTWCRWSHRTAGAFWVIVGVCLWSLTAATPAVGSPAYDGEPLHTFVGSCAAPWSFVERHDDPHPRFPYEPHHEQGRHILSTIREQFGTCEPPSSSFLLHGAPSWNDATHPEPVLLLPGAYDNATLRYAQPFWGKDGDYDDLRPGLAQYLAARGHAVFGLTFAHGQGCNLHQGEQVANAIRRIAILLGRERDPDFRVNIVTYSKSIFAARCYLQDAGSFYGMNHLTPYRGDVNHVIFLVGPIAGMDSPYRYYTYPLVAQGHSGFPPMPQPAEAVLKWGTWQTACPDASIFSPYWKGTRQCLADLREIGIPLRPYSWTPVDANMTMRALYDGGTSPFLASRGLDAVVEAGGRLVARLNERGLPSEVTASLGAGTHPIMLSPERFFGFRIPIIEPSAPSDGCVFVASALYEKGLTARGARVVGTETWPLNHIDVSRSEDVWEWVAQELKIHGRHPRAADREIESRMVSKHEGGR